MTRDYITYVIQGIQDLIENVHMQEEAIKDGKELKDSQKQKDAEKAAERARETLRRATQSPSAIFQFLAASEEADATAFRTMWQMWQWKNPKVDYLLDNVRSYYEENFESPSIDLTVLPAFSFVLQFTFTLAQPYISRDEQDFYIIDNPVRKDKVFGLPYVASTSWKGSLRSALWQSGHKAESASICHLFGNEKGTEDPEKFQAGCLYFFPTFFKSRSLEIINPQDRKLRVGKNPIPFESVPEGTRGVFTLLYVPFDLISRDEKATREQVVRELQLIGEGLQAMFRNYGFGAKTSSGFGLAKETIPGSLRVRMPGSERLKEDEITIAPPPAPSLPRYLEAPDRLKREYLTKESTFRKRPEAELKKMSKSDKQMYEKAKSWWEREGKQLAEAAKQPKPAEPAPPEPLPQTQPPSWPEWSFDSFGRLLEYIKEVANKLSNGDAV